MSSSLFVVCICQVMFADVCLFLFVVVIRCVLYVRCLLAGVLCSLLLVVDCASLFVA